MTINQEREKKDLEGKQLLKERYNTESKWSTSLRGTGFTAQKFEIFFIMLGGASMFEVFILLRCFY